MEEEAPFTDFRLSSPVVTEIGCFLSFFLHTYASLCSRSSFPKVRVLLIGHDTPGHVLWEVRFYDPLQGFLCAKPRNCSCLKSCVEAEAEKTQISL